MDVLVAESVMFGGWCIYVQSKRGEYDVVRGPYQSQEDAQAAMDDWLDETDPETV